MPKSEIYVSTDVETDGPIPGPHSMLSFASVAFSGHGEELASFSRNLEILPGASAHPETMRWWDQNQPAWATYRLLPRTPIFALRLSLALAAGKRIRVCLGYRAP